jgi:hypothetical protein
VKGPPAAPPTTAVTPETPVEIPPFPRFPFALSAFYGSESKTPWVTLTVDAPTTVS